MIGSRDEQPFLPENPVKKMIKRITTERNLWYHDRVKQQMSEEAKKRMSEEAKKRMSEEANERMSESAKK